MNTATQSRHLFYRDFFTDDGYLRIPVALDALRLLGLDRKDNLYDIVRQDKLDEWPLPSWIAAQKEVDSETIAFIVGARSCGMSVESILIGASASIPNLCEWLAHGSLDNDSGEQSAVAYLARQWNIAYHRKQVDVLDKLAKDNPVQYLKRTDKTGDFDDHEYMRQLRYKADLDKEEQSTPRRVVLDFGDDG